MYYESLLITHITDIIIKDLKDFQGFPIIMNPFLSLISLI